MLARRTLQSSVRMFSTSRIAMTEGAISQGKDSFAEKERTQENLYIRKHEAEQLKALKKQLDEQKKLVDDLKSEVDKLKK